MKIILHPAVKKLIRITLRCLAGMVILFALIAAILQCYFLFHKQEILRRFSQDMNRRLQGEVQIRDASLNVIRYFPNFAITLKEVSLKDSVYHLAAISIRKLFIRVPAVKVVTGKIAADDITVGEGYLRLFTDSKGYTNRYLLVPKNTGAGSRENGSREFFKSIHIKDFRCTVSDTPARKNFDGMIRSMIIRVKSFTPQRREYAISSSLMINGLAFNLDKGSFLQHAVITGDYTITDLRDQGIISIPEANIRINDDPFAVSLKIEEQPVPHFTLQITGKALYLEKTAHLLTKNIRQSLSPYHLQQPVYASAVISGKAQKGEDPVIRIRMNTDNNTFDGPIGSLTDCRITGTFYNHNDPALPASDENTLIVFTGISGKYEGMPVITDTLTIHDLTRPHVRAHVTSSYTLPQLQALTGDNLFKLRSGSGNADLYIDAYIQGKNIDSLGLTGDISLKEGTLLYVPKNLLLKRVHGNIVLQHNNLKLENFNIQLGNTSFRLNATADNLLQLITTNPERATFKWTFHSAKVQLQDLLPWLSTRHRQVVAKTAAAGKPYQLVKVINTVDNWLDKCDISVQGDIDALHFHHFTATNIKGQMDMGDTYARLNSFVLNHAGGKLFLQGSLAEKDSLHNGDIKVQMKGININEVFTAFDNFNLPSLHADNLKGTLDADISLKLSMDQQLKVIPSSTQGQAAITLKNGELINFTPLMSLSQFLFKNRHLDSVRFAPLKQTFYINGRGFDFTDLTIRSSAISFSASGHYSLDNGQTNILVRIPLRELEGRREDWNTSTDAIFRKNALNLYIRAKDNLFGRMRFSFVRLGKERPSRK